MLDFRPPQPALNLPTPASPLYRRIAGVLVEPIGHLWACFSPATGETALLNDECAAVLEVLEEGDFSTATMCDALAVDTGQTAQELQDAIAGAWQRLVEAGLVREVASD